MSEPIETFEVNAEYAQVQVWIDEAVNFPDDWSESSYGASSTEAISFAATDAVDNLVAVVAYFGRPEPHDVVVYSAILEAVEGVFILGNVPAGDEYAINLIPGRYRVSSVADNPERATNLNIYFEHLV